MKHELRHILEFVLARMGVGDVIPTLTRPEHAVHGDYATNVALVLANRLQRKPIDIANEIKSSLEQLKTQCELDKKHQKTSNNDLFESLSTRQKYALQAIAGITVAGPGFINISIVASSLISQTQTVLKQPQPVLVGQKQLTASNGVLTAVKPGGRVMVEYAHPNTHKAFHIGHLRNITTGESLVRLLEAAGYEVIRANYQGDVGMHIAKCLWAMLHVPECRIEPIREKSVSEKVEFLGKAYAAGSKAYEEKDTAKADIAQINKQIYAKDPVIYDLYRETRQWSLDYFESVYKRVGTHYDRYYFEGEVYEAGKKAVLDGLAKGVFVESDGAVIFPGEHYGLHNRVFITGEGNPTYEGKDIGLAPLQFAEYQPQLIVHVVGPEQAGYFQVVFKALEQIHPETTGREYHLIYGWVKLKHGKMSSRSGNVVLGSWLLDEAKLQIKAVLKSSTMEYPPEKEEDIAEKAAVAAVKYAFLRVSTTQEIAFDFAQSISFTGESGPYLQYTYARCQSILRKHLMEVPAGKQLSALNDEERMVARWLMYFPEIVEEAALDFSPSTICTYLFALAQSYNVLYAKHQILADSVSEDARTRRLILTETTAQVLKQGLYLLGIETLEQM